MMMLYVISESGTVNIPADWMNRKVEDAVDSVKQHYRQSGYKQPWVCYLASEKGEPVGTCGFVGEPKDGKVEFHYATFPGREDTAADMVRKLIEITEYHDKQSLRVIRTPAQESEQNSFLKGLNFVSTAVEEHGKRLWEWRYEYRGRRY